MRRGAGFGLAALALFAGWSGGALAGERVLFCKHEEMAVNLSKLSNKDIADKPGLEGMHPTVYFREAALHKLCFFVEAASRRTLRTVYRGPGKGSYSVVESEVVSPKGGARLRGFVLTRGAVPSP